MSTAEPSVRDFEPLLPEADLGVGAVRGFVVNGWPVLVARSASGIHAMLNRCSHAASALSGGRVRRNFIICPLHGAQFDLATGACLSPTRYPTIRTFPVEVSNGMIAVQVPDTQPTVEELPIPAA